MGVGMSQIEFTIRKNSIYWDVSITVGSTRIDLGLKSDEEMRDMAEELTGAAADLLPSKYGREMNALYFARERFETAALEEQEQ